MDSPEELAQELPKALHRRLRRAATPVTLALVRALTGRS